MASVLPFFEKRGGPRIITIGDSFTFGEGVREDDTFPWLMERNLGIETINLAMQGLNTRNEYLILKKHIYLRPNLVVLGYVLNDTMPHKETIRDIDLIDLFEIYKNMKASDLWVHPTDQHPNVLPHKLAYIRIANWIEENAYNLFN